MPGLSKVLERVKADQEERVARRIKQQEEKKRLEKEKALRERYPNAPWLK